MNFNFRFFLAASMALFALSHTSGFAQKMNKQDAEALDETKALLRNSKQRSDSIQGNADAQKADQNVRQLGGTQENVDGIYDLSADMMDMLTKKAMDDDGNVDSAKLQTLIQELMKNPKSLEKDMTPAQRAKLKKIADSVDAQQKTKP